MPTFKGQGKEKLMREDEKGQLKAMSVGLKGPGKCLCQDQMSGQQ